MLSILNHYRSDADQNDNKGSNPIWQNGHSNCLQTVHGGESWEMMESPFVLPANRRWQQPFEGSACTGQNKTVKRTKARILIPTPAPTFRKTSIQNYTCRKKKTKTKLHMHLSFHCSGTSNCQDSDPRKSPLTDTILKNVVHIYIHIPPVKL